MNTFPPHQMTHLSLHIAFHVSALLPVSMITSACRPNSHLLYIKMCSIMLSTQARGHFPVSTINNPNTCLLISGEWDPATPDNEPCQHSPQSTP
jgi:hypothetical protein